MSFPRYILFRDIPIWGRHPWPEFLWLKSSGFRTRSGILNKYIIITGGIFCMLIMKKLQILNCLSEDALYIDLQQLNLIHYSSLKIYLKYNTVCFFWHRIFNARYTSTVNVLLFKFTYCSKCRIQIQEIYLISHFQVNLLI